MIRPLPIKSAFIFSVLMNIFLASVIVAHMFFSSLPSPFKDNPVSHMESAIVVVSPQYQEPLKALVQEKKLTMEEQFKKLRVLFYQIKPVLTAPSFDETKLESLHKEIVTQDNAVKNDVLDLVSRIAKSLPDEERVKFFNKAMEFAPRLRSEDK